MTDDSIEELIEDGDDESLEVLPTVDDGRKHFDASQIVRAAVDTTSPRSKRYLRWLCERGLQRLVFPKFADPEFKHTEKEYRDRLEYELEVIEGMGYVDYFLIVQDYVNYAKNHNIPTGPGRGSAAGALVSYVTGITGIDPIPYGLYFERFLNPGRKGMPDIDIDFPQSKRQEIIAHIRHLYGNDRVAQIATFSYMAARGSVRDAARILGFPAEFGDKISKMVSDKPKAKISEDLIQGTELYNFYHQNPDVKDVVDTALRLEGLIRQGSIHASALVIAPVDITDKMPLQTPKKSQMAKLAESGLDLSSLLVQFDGPTVESLGYLKMDILGLGTLDVIEDTLEFIKKTKGINLTLPEIPFDDPKTFELLSAGETNGVFQVESGGMKGTLRDIKPTKFEEIGDIIALYRPGPMEYIPTYKAGKEKPEKVRYLVPQLKPILEGTYGVACIAENSSVAISNGNKKIQDILVGDMVLTEDGTYRKCLANNFKGVKPTVTVRADFGEELICTADHKVLTQLGWVPAGDLTSEHLIKAFNPTVKNRNIEEFNWEDWLVGLFVADGHSPAGVPSIACCSEKFANSVKTIIEQCFPNMRGVGVYSSSNGLGTTWYVKIAQTSARNNGFFSADYVPNEFNTLLKKHGLYRATKSYKRWPASYSFSTIIGFIEGDGCYQNRRVSLKHRHLAHSLYSALLVYGVRASFFRRDSHSWSVGFSLIEELRPKIRMCDYNRITKGNYIPKEYLVSCASAMNSGQRKNLLLGKRGRTPYISTETAQRYGWAEEAEQHSLWARVLSIKLSSETPVYDLSVETNHSFVVGGLVVHNCYQEQLMEIAKEIGGFTLAEADDLRKAISKKKYELLMKLEAKFHDGCLRTGIAEKTIPELWKLMEAASGYSFNKSHAFSYAVVCYQTAYLKANYPAEFMASQMTYKKDDQDSIKEYINDCKKFGINVIPPSVNYSSIDFDITPKGDISFGLAALKGVGYGPAIDIITAREEGGEFKDLNDFLDRVKVNSKVYEILAKSGALDGLGWTRRALIEEKERVINFVKSINKKVDYGLQQGFDFGDEVETAKVHPQIIKEYAPDTLLDFEYEMLGMYLTGHPIEFYELSRRLKMKGMPKRSLYNIGQLPKLQDKDEVYTFGIVQTIKRFESKKGWMGFITLADFGTGEESYNGMNPRMHQFDLVLFTDAYSNWGYKMRENDFIAVHGRMNLRRDRNELSLIADDITFMLKDKEIDYQNDSVMRKIVMDVLEEMNAEKEELLAESSKLRLVLEREATAETSAPRFASEPMEVALPVVLEDDILEVLPDIPSGRTAPPELATTPAEESAPSSSEEAVSTSVPPVEVAVPARVRLQVDNENYMDALKIVKNNPGETEVIVSMEGEDQKLSSITLTHRVRMALEFAGISLSEE